MGLGSSGQPAPLSPEVQQQLDALPMPHCLESLWMVSCRPLRSMRYFSPQLLLFQPDCRLFCPHGLKCACLQSSGGAKHGELYIHTAVEAIQADADRDCASRSPTTVVVNTPCVTVALPFVQQCWSVEHSEDISMLPAELRERTTVVWVHGFRQRFFRVVSVTSHLLHSLREHTEGGKVPDIRAPAVVAFLWPCHSRGAAYGRARADAEGAAPRLAALLRTLRLLGGRVVVIGHSLGCRVALKALLKDRLMATSAATPGAGVMCDHLMLLGAAVSSNALSADGEFPRGRVDATHITVLHSEHDHVLRTYFPLGEMASKALQGSLLSMCSDTAAMGLEGLRAEHGLSVTSADVSSTVFSHNPNLWLRSADVMRYIRSAVYNEQVLASADTSESVHVGSSADAFEDSFAEDMNDASSCAASSVACSLESSSDEEASDIASSGIEAVPADF